MAFPILENVVLVVAGGYWPPDQAGLSRPRPMLERTAAGHVNGELFEHPNRAQM